MQQLTDNLLDEQYILEFDELVNSTLNRIDYSYNTAFKNYDRDSLKVFNSLSSVSSNSSLSSISSLKEKCQNKAIAPRTLSLNSNSYYTGAHFKPVIHDKENNQRRDHKKTKYTTSKSESMIDRGLSIPDNVHTAYKTPTTYKIHNKSNNKKNLATQTDTEFNLSAYYSNDNMCSSMVDNNNNNDNDSGRVKAKDKAKQAKKIGRPVRRRFQFNLINDLIVNLVKCMNEMSRVRRVRRVRRQKGKIPALLNCLDRLVLEAGLVDYASSDMWRSFMAMFVRALLSEGGRRQPRLRAKAKVRGTILLERDTSVRGHSTDRLEEEGEEEGAPWNNEDSDECQNCDQTQQSGSRFEIPNIEDPCQFIDTLYNRLLANSETESEHTHANVSHASEWAESESVCQLLGDSNAISEYLSVDEQTGDIDENISVIDYFYSRAQNVSGNQAIQTTELEEAELEPPRHHGSQPHVHMESVARAPVLLPSLATAAPSISIMGFSYAVSNRRSQPLFSPGKDFQKRLFALVSAKAAEDASGRERTHQDPSDSTLLADRSLLGVTESKRKRGFFGFFGFLFRFSMPWRALFSSEVFACHRSSALLGHLTNCLKYVVLTKNQILLPLVLLLLNQTRVSSAILSSRKLYLSVV